MSKGEKLEFIPSKYTCWMPNYYLDNNCDKCSFKSIALCVHNGYEQKKDRKSAIEEQFEQLESITAEEISKKVKGKKK